MKFNLIFKAFLIFFIIITVASCDKDYNEIGTNIVDDNHYNYLVDSTKTIVAYNQNVGAIQTNNLTLNALGYYNHPVFGKTTASFVSQVELASVNPTFIDAASIIVDSVYLYVPYFVRNNKTETNATTGNKTYVLDSIKGTANNSFNLSVYESGYYLRDLDPTTGFQQSQKYYSNQNSMFDANKIGSRLNNVVASQNDEFSFSPNEYKISYKRITDGTEVIKERKAPGIWLDLDKNFFLTKIFNAPADKLLNNNVFKEYFRGLYFKVEPNSKNPEGAAMGLLNFQQGKIVIEYREKKDANDTTPPSVNKTLTLNLSGNTVNCFENASTAESAAFNAAMANNIPDDATGDEKLYLKGQQGAITVIDILNAAEIKQMKNDKWLINEANLTFYVDKKAMGTSVEEPNRVYLYDLNNNTPIFDYYTDGSTATNTKFNKLLLDGIIKKQTVSGGRGIQYKIRLTNHIRNLINNDSTNIKLGLAVTESINLISSARLQSSTQVIDRIPVSSVINPLGTVLFGSKPVKNPSDPYDPTGEKRRLKLKIYYTKPKS